MGVIKDYLKKMERGAKFSKVESMSKDKFGFDRGKSIDRYYIERFLSENRKIITGRVMEIADAKYSKKFGHDVTAFEIFSFDKEHQHATITGDLTKQETLKEDFLDCFICTQTYNFIYDFRKAVEGSRKMLKPGGVLLTTVAGLCQISRYDMDRWGDFWRFTDLSIKKSFGEIFGEQNVKVSTYGNSLSASAFVKGLASEELTPEELDFNDHDYQIVICAAAKK